MVALRLLVQALRGEDLIRIKGTSVQKCFHSTLMLVSAIIIKSFVVSHVLSKQQTSSVASLCLHTDFFA